MKNAKFALVFAAAAVCGTAQAALVDRGGGMIYDTDRNITWLSDWNYAMTSGFDSDGKMTWANANLWASNLVYGGFDDWRLPTSLNANGTGPCGTGTSQMFNCVGSELGHMYYTELGAVAGGSGFQSGANTANVALFTNMQLNFYWSSTEFAPDTSKAWSFSGGGNQSAADKTFELYAVAVRNGDVAAAVPEPATFALTLIGLAGVGFVACRRPSARVSRIGNP